MAWPLLQSLKRFMLYQRVLMWFVQRRVLNEDNQPTCRRQRLKFDELLKSVCLSREGCFVLLASGSVGGLEGWRAGGLEGWLTGGLLCSKVEEVGNQCSYLSSLS